MGETAEMLELVRERGTEVEEVVLVRVAGGVGYVGAGADRVGGGASYST